MDLLWCFWITRRRYHLLADWRWCYPPLLKVQHADIIRLITTKELRPLINSVGVISSVLYFIIIKYEDETKLFLSLQKVFQLQLHFLSRWRQCFLAPAPHLDKSGVTPAPAAPRSLLAPALEVTGRPQDGSWWGNVFICDNYDWTWAQVFIITI